MNTTAHLSQQFVDFFSVRASSGEPMVLVAVLATSGSTYSKSGNLLLIDSEGESSGLLSGGCLEEDLAERAARVMASGVADVFSYDLTADDEVFGFGVGCEGTMQILLAKLDAATDHEPLGSVIARLERARAGVLESSAGSYELALNVQRPRRVLLLGAGRDAVPLVRFCRSLGWHTSVSDHRPEYIERIGQERPHIATCIPADELESTYDLDDFDAVVVMSHHLGSDRTYLARLADTSVAYVGLMGPPHRRDRLLADIGDKAMALDGRLRSPVGMRIGGRGPSAIALEVAAQLQAFFSDVNA